MVVSLAGARQPLVGGHRLHLKRDEPLPVGGARRPLARCSYARRDDLRGQAQRAGARLVGRSARVGLAATHPRAESGDPRPARADRRVLAAALKGWRAANSRSALGYAPGDGAALNPRRHPGHDSHPPKDVCGRRSLYPPHVAGPHDRNGDQRVVRRARRVVTPIAAKDSSAESDGGALLRRRSIRPGPVRQRTKGSSESRHPQPVRAFGRFVRTSPVDRARRRGSRVCGWICA